MVTDDDWQREMERYLAHFKRAGKRPTILFAHHGQTSPVWAPTLFVSRGRRDFHPKRSSPSRASWISSDTTALPA